MRKKVAWDYKLLTKLNGLTAWQVFSILTLIGLCVFFSGLGGGFQGDDNLQIVDNVPVHSLKNISYFFGSSTFWNGEGLVGSFYRPIMTTTFSFIYSLFGANPTAFHVVQLLLYIGCTFAFFLFLKTFFKPAVALLAALIFLVHPINSQVVYAIPSMQEPLFFLFGMLALLTLSRSQTNRSLGLASLFLLLSLFSKETGIVFACLALLYVGLFHRQKIISFIKIAAIAAVLYLLMRAGAVGLFPAAIHAAPISQLGFTERMMTVPSLIVFYISKFLFPANLATSYYWTSHNLSITDIVISSVVTLIVAAGFIYAGIMVCKKQSKKVFTYYIFFAVWATLGFLPYLQIIPLDMTACETWLLSGFPGFLGMLIIALSPLAARRRPQWIYFLVIPIIIILSVRTAVRGFDYQTQFTLASKDISVTKDNYLAMNNLAQSLIHQNKLSEAAIYARRSAAIYPAVTNYTNLGVVLQKQNDFAGAKKAYEKALQYGSLGITYENLGVINLTIGESGNTIKFLHDALKAYPRDSKLWIYLALQEGANGSRSEARKAITTAAKYGSVPRVLYDAIINEKPLDIPLPGSNKIIHLQ